MRKKRIINAVKMAITVFVGIVCIQKANIFGKGETSLHTIWEEIWEYYIWYDVFFAIIVGIAGFYLTRKEKEVI